MSPVYLGTTEFVPRIGATAAKVYLGTTLLHDPAPAPVDRPGTLTLDATRQSRGANIDYSVTDPDGIRAVTSVVMLAGDDTRSDVTSKIARTDANTFGGTSRRLNNKWRVGSITIVYADATSGASHTLTQSWSL